MHAIMPIDRNPATRSSPSTPLPCLSHACNSSFRHSSLSFLRAIFSLDRPTICRISSMNASAVPKEFFCFLQGPRWSRGYFFGESPFSSGALLLLAQLGLCSLVAAVMNHCLSAVGQSLFVSQILTGILLGPSVLGRNQLYRDLFFPASSFYLVDTFAFFGVMLSLFIIGVKTDLTLIQKAGKRALAIGMCTFLVPLFLSSLVSKIIRDNIHMELRLYRSLIWIASFQSLSTFHVIVCLLADLKLMKSELGKLAIPTSLISGSFSFFWVVIVIAGKTSVDTKWQTSLLRFLCFLSMVLFAIFVFRPLVLWIIRHTNDENSIKESHVCAIFILVLGSAMYGEYFGQHFTLGPMILGMVIPDGPPLGSALVNKLEMLVFSIILPLFFVITAAKINFSAIVLRNFAIIEILSVIAFIGKVVGVILPSLLWKIPLKKAFYLGLILSNQGIMDVLLLERARAVGVIDNESFSVMLLSISILTGILAPVLKFFYQPSKRYMAGERMSIQRVDPNAEMRILACLHYQEHTRSLISLFEASYPHPHAPICFYVVHLLDLAGRSAPVFVAHQPGMRNSSQSYESERIFNALRIFEHEHQGYVSVYPFTAMSPYSSMHEDICSLAAERVVSLVIVLFHKHPRIELSDAEAHHIKAVNLKIVEESPCTVGILVDHGAMSCITSNFLHAEAFRIGMIFLGGPDDREALAYARRMAKHRNACLTLLKFRQDNLKTIYSHDVGLDLDMMEDYKGKQMKNKQCFYQEELVKDSIAVVSVIKSMADCFDLIVVGRRHDKETPLLAGWFDDWDEFPELGCVGNMLVSLDSGYKPSVLVVQQSLHWQENLEWL